MNSTTISRYKGKSYPKLHETAKRWFHKFIRLRDTDDNGYGNCIATGQRLRYGTESAQAGHYYAAGKYKALEFNEYNVNLQSLQDNYYGHDFANYGYNLERKIGEGAFGKLKQLAAISKRTPYRQDRFLMIDIIERYKEKVKELAKTKMFEVK